MAASTVPRFSTAATYHLRHCPQLPVSRLPAIPRPASSCETLAPATRISLSAATAPTHLRSHRRATSPPSAMASEATSAATAASGKQGLLVFDSEEELSVSLAKYTAELSAKFVRERGAFTVVLSGGSLIQSLRKLTESPYLESVDWAKWHVFWVDERVVPKDHEDSNYKLAFDGFLSKVSIPPGQVYAINDALSAEGAAEDYETALKHLVNVGVVAVSSVTGYPRFDLMLLGMGPDGHIASLFPGHPLLHVTEKWGKLVLCVRLWEVRKVHLICYLLRWLPLKMGNSLGLLIKQQSQCFKIRQACSHVVSCAGHISRAD
ncbi:hypothetical protein OPV22_028591 [Ensete ventricosum]|uniref:Probable 6-phosphogluconolactonase n=1 Tax=Ensete ventricosum TaxID=4639 RepID=A0AAV8Q441_ENSVE|nr:hypothetical protein OPV22_028591 [Ensete ventricosum]